MKIKRKQYTSLWKKARRGFRGYPVATVAFYGLDDTKATKVAVGIVTREDTEPDVLERWFSETEDLRYSAAVEGEILRFIQSHGARSVAMIGRIIGCPHEEGIDYPLGENCPQCPFWANRPHWSEERIH